MNTVGYLGDKDRNVFFVARRDPPRALNPRFDLANHSPDGFNWGYGGSGPAQLALAICADALEGDQARALRVYMDFKWKVVTKLETGRPWQMTIRSVIEAVQEIELERRRNGRT
jgi:hypothetical protein